MSWGGFAQGAWPRAIYSQYGAILDPELYVFLESWIISRCFVIFFLVTTSIGYGAMKAFVDILLRQGFMTFFAPLVVKNRIFAMILV